MLSVILSSVLNFYFLKTSCGLHFAQLILLIFYMRVMCLHSSQGGNSLSPFYSELFGYMEEKLTGQDVTWHQIHVTYFKPGSKFGRKMIWLNTDTIEYA